MNKMQVLYKKVYSAKQRAAEVPSSHSAKAGWQIILDTDSIETSKILATLTLSVIELKDFSELEAEIENEEILTQWVDEVLIAVSNAGIFRENLKSLSTNALSALHSYSKNWSKQFETKIKKDQEKVNSILNRLRTEIDNIKESDISDELKIYLVFEFEKLYNSILKIDEVGVENIKDQLMLTIANIHLNKNAENYVSENTSIKEILDALANLITITGVSLPVLVGTLSNILLP
ncbi:hypothetical protein KTJ16_21445 [Acinetobacter bereziniae]|jgi:hypothetical protein|uniref:hypothetical protein n=1 Tax=Acinetobacter bereziniae TaxID=106648 RepID=UPI000EF6680D|nr:hypothetical protein [Acinetobacter bereziniae]MBJ8422539.1 hypothetical protein [Acinetobacter bereziniae]MCU4475303.1 hypothetical protein [Acinetobacter bereziniae]MCU4543702.1 hypothetical protein [Acinetobacter bereziniae]MCU4628066.1 hypothetical protein [Acinetobacter bereziniae]